MFTLDYIWTSQDLKSDIQVRYDMDFNADHRPLEISFQLDAWRHRRKIQKTTNHKHIDWKDAESRDFLRKHWERIARGVDLNVQTLEGQVLHAISATPKSKWTRPARPIALQNAFSALEVAEEGPEKVLAARVVYREKRREQDNHKTQNFIKNATSALCVKKSAAVVQAECLKCEGELTGDRTKWSQEVSSFYADLYKDPSARKGILNAEVRQSLIIKQRERLALIRSDRQWNRQPDVDIPLWMMLQTRAKHSNGLDTAPGSVGITWRTLASFPASLVNTLRKSFNDRINAKTAHRGPVKEWSEVIVRLIPKVHRPVEVKDWRPISLSS
jgi:hypothetical protein